MKLFFLMLDGLAFEYYYEQTFSSYEIKQGLEGELEAIVLDWSLNKVPKGVIVLFGFVEGKLVKPIYLEFQRIDIRTLLFPIYI